MFISTLISVCDGQDDDQYFCYSRQISVLLHVTDSLTPCNLFVYEVLVVEAS